MTIPQSVPMPAPFTQGSLQCGKSPRGGRQKISAATGRSLYVRVAHKLVVKGYARPAFGGTSRRRSIMKNHQLSWWVTFFYAVRGVPRRMIAPPKRHTADGRRHVCPVVSAGAACGHGVGGGRRSPFPPRILYKFIMFPHDKCPKNL